MKTLSKISLKENELTIDEVKQLKGGVHNKNTTYTCSCTYNDRNGVRNSNGMSGCSCTCVF